MTDPTLTAAATPNRRPFFIVLALFFAPLLIAFAVYYGSSWRPTGTTNKGDLISPAIPLPAVTLTTADGKQTDASFLRDTWTLVYVDKGECAAVCRKALNDIRDARLLLGKDITRVSRAFLYTGGCCDPAYFQAEQVDLLSASLDSDDGQKLLNLLPATEGVAALDGQRIYIVDPLGNLMMSYAPGVNPRDVYQDIKKLLGLSHIG